MNEFFWFPLVGLIAGCLAGTLLKGGRLGAIGDIAVGVLGAVVGGVLFHFTRIDVGGMWAPLLAAALGAALLIFDMRLVQKSYAERWAALTRFGRCAPTSQLRLAPQHKGTANEPCSVCGQKHLI